MAKMDAPAGYTREEIEAEIQRRGLSSPDTGYSREEVEAELKRRGIMPETKPIAGASAHIIANKALDEGPPAKPPVSPTDIITPTNPMLMAIKSALPDNYKHLVDQFVRGAGFGWTDQAVGAVGAMLEGESPVGDKASEYAAADRAVAEADRKKELERGESVGVLGYRVTPGDVAEFGGSTAAAAPLAGGLVAKAGKAAAPAWTGMAKTAAGAAEGAAFGGVMGGGMADTGDRLAGATRGAVGGAVVGGVLTRLGVSYERYAAAKAARRAATTVDDVKAAAGAMYDEAERLGAIYKPSASTGLRNNLDNIVANEALSEGSDPLVIGAIRHIQKMIDGGPVDMKVVAKMKKVIRRNMERTKAGSEDARVLMKVRNAVEDFAIDDANMLAFGVNGAGKNAAEVRKEADLLWRNAKTAENVETLINKATMETMATGSGGNINNKIRQVFTKIAADPKKMRAYSPAEREAIEAVVKQGTTDAVLRQIGKLSMSGNGLIQALQLYAAVNTGGLSALTIPVATAAKYAADTKTSKLAQNVITVILSGGKVPPASMRALTAQERNVVARAVAGVVTARQGEAVGDALMPVPATP